MGDSRGGTFSVKGDVVTGEYNNFWPNLTQTSLKNWLHLNHTYRNMDMSKDVERCRKEVVKK